MQKVIIINLNGVAYHLEDSAYALLSAYLDRAAETLRDSPDRVEIMADLEEAIADKCNRALGAQKTVVTEPEMAQILAEMGPVEAAAGEAGPKSDHAGASEDAKSGATKHGPRRLYLLREGSMLSGVCMGLAAFSGIDVTIIRIAFVVLAVVTRGVWVGVYVVLMFVVPYANTPEERAAALGEPFNAQDVIERAKRNFSAFGRDDWWRRHSERQQRRERQRRSSGAPAFWTRDAYSYPPGAPPDLSSPALALANAAGLVAFAYVVVSLVNDRGILGWTLPAGVPLWAALVVLLLLYHLLMSPVHMARHVAARYSGAALRWDGLWFWLIVLCVWLAYRHVPEIHDALQRFGANLPGVWEEFRSSWQR